VTAGQYQVRTQCEPDAATSDRALHALMTGSGKLAS
jgi:hypothetical protein